MKKIRNLKILLSAVAFLFLFSVNAGYCAETAPDFTLSDLSGKKITLSSFRGNPVLLNFWATWCGYCRRERPHLNSLYNAYKDKGLVVISVSTDRSVEKVREYLKDIPADFIVLSDAEGSAVAQYGVRGYPSSFLIDRHGLVKYAVAGYRNWTDDASKKMIDQLINGE